MDRWCVAVAGFVVGMALFASPTLAKDQVEALPDIAAAPEYSVTLPRDFLDVKLAGAPAVAAGDQAIAVNPKNPNVFLVAYADAYQRSCWVRTSTNAGRTWAAARELPLPAVELDYCSSPAVIWAPNGSRVYAAYVYVLNSHGRPGETGAVVISSGDGGLTWSPPKIAIRYPFPTDSNPITMYHLNLSTPLRSSDDRWVYLLSAIKFDFHFSKLDFISSADRGQTWRSGQELARIDQFFSTISYPSLAGGLGGDVLVSWGECRSDDIYIKRSNDYGRGFSDKRIAVPGNGGPCRDTAVAFGSGGTAHIVYNQHVVGPWGIYYVYSTKAPYTEWSQPVALNDTSSADGYFFPALSVSPCGSGGNVLNVTWTEVSDGMLNMQYTRKVAKTGEEWSPNLRISEVARPDWSTIAIAGGGRTAVALWGDQSFGGNVGLWASRIAPGVNCP